MFLLRIGVRGRIPHVEFAREEHETPQPQGDVFANTERGYGSEDDDLQARRCGF